MLPIKIELKTEEEAMVFKFCWKNYKVFREALRVLRPGKLILHFNSSGEAKPEFNLPGKESVGNLTRPFDENIIK